MASKSRSKHQGSLYAHYKAEQRWAKNRREKLEKLALVHPNNLQITEALKNIKYRRKTPSTSAWSKSDRAAAQLIKQFEGHVNVKELQKERIVFGASEHKKHNSPVRESNNPRGFFSLGARAHDSQGALIWSN